MKITRPPSETFSKLFRKVHELKIFADAKVMSDVIPLYDSSTINRAFENLEEHSTETIEKFLRENFKIPTAQENDFKTNVNHSLTEHINHLWQILKREKDEYVEGSSLVPLPYPYIVPGGRFNEIYYWDSYFTMLGLKVSGENDLIESMIKNFAHQIDQFGHIPNGNRTYFLSRSQPPFFALMVELLAQIKGEQVLSDYLPQLKKEYSFWMDGSEELSEDQNVINRVTLQKNGYLLNRYFDHLDTPRDEMYPDDVHLANETNQDPKTFYRHIRAACESGWDFSSRWLTDPMQLSSINAANILPIDLNCLLYQLEVTISRGSKLSGDLGLSHKFAQMANSRKSAINTTFWNEDENFFFDFDIKKRGLNSVISTAALFPLFTNIVDKEKAIKVAEKIKDILLKPGGILCTPINSGQQWDAPNGWAPLQYISVIGLMNYNLTDLALDIAKKWTALNVSVFKSTGKMLEKYNVENLDLKAGGGEYPVQDGFGWTNGVYLALSEIIKKF